MQKTEPEQLQHWLEKLRKASKEKIVLVEGIKDKAALKQLGIKNILTISGPLYKVAEKIHEKAKDCILLVDLDAEGKKLYHKFVQDLASLGVRIDSTFRDFLFKTKLRQIEGILSYTQMFNFVHY